MAFTVLQPGLLTSVQDKGRMGWMASGFSPSGVMDHRAFTLANLLVQNNADDPVLEFALLGPTIRFEDEAVIALTGGNFNPTLDGEAVPMYQALHIMPGQTLAMSGAQRGVYGYMAISSGGISVPRIMGSASTNIKCGIGGFEGRTLRKGDVVPFNEAHPDPNWDFSVNRYRNDPYYNFGYAVQTIRVIPGPQSELFATRGINTFYSSTYTVSPQSDRMGFRLNGPAIETLNGSDIVSDGIAFGAIQVPAQGTPIVMLSDRQTTGGYAKIATVATVDIPLLVQRQAGQAVRFVPISVIEAQQLLAHEMAYYREVENVMKGRTNRGR